MCTASRTARSVRFPVPCRLFTLLQKLDKHAFRFQTGNVKYYQAPLNLLKLFSPKETMLASRINPKYV